MSQFFKKYLEECKQWLYFWRYLGHYNIHLFKGDVKGALNTSFLGILQGMGHSLIAGLPIDYGIRAVAVAMFFAAFFSRSIFITPSSTNATAITLGSAFAAMGIMDAVARGMLIPVLLGLVGIFLLIAAFLGAGRVTQYISRSVLIGYMTAAVLLLVAGQMDKILGLEIPASTLEATTSFLARLGVLVSHLNTYHVGVLATSLVTLLIYFLLQRYFRHLPNALLAVILISVIVYVTQAVIGHPFLNKMDFLNAATIQMLDPIELTVMPVEHPIKALNFENFAPLAHIALALAILCLLENVSVGKSLASASGKRYPVSYQVFSLGMGNLACGLGAGMPISASMVRSKTTVDGGARTPLVFLYAAFLIFLISFLLEPAIPYIPLAAISSIVSIIALSLLNFKNISLVTSATSDDAIVFYATLATGLLAPLHVAVLVGVGISVTLFLRRMGSPELVEYDFDAGGHLLEIDPKKRRVPEISILHLEGDLFFGGAEIFQDQIRRVSKDKNLKVIIIKMRNARHLDATVAFAIKGLLTRMKRDGRLLLFSECKAPAIKLFKKTRLMEEIGPDALFADDPKHPNLSTKKALEKARAFLGPTEAEVKVFVKSKNKKDQ